MTLQVFQSYITIQSPDTGFIPIRINSKKAPVDPCWNTTPPVLTYDPNQLYGMMPPPDILVVDIDVKNGKQGQESWERFLADNYPPDVITEHFRYPAVHTPSGGFHFYIPIRGLDYHDIPKTHPDYPGIDFITHGKSQVVAGGQQLENGEYRIGIMTLMPPLASLNCFTRSNTLPPHTKRVTIDFLRQKKGISNISTAQISKILSYISPDDYETWYKVAFMLLGSGLPEEDARTLFHDWSAGSDKYSPHDCEKKWSELKIDYAKPGKEPLTIASLPFLAKEQSPDKIDEINEIYRPSNHLEGRFLLIENRKGSPTSYYDLKNKMRVSSDYVQREMQPYIQKLKEKLNSKKEPTLSKLKDMGIIDIVHAEVYAPDKPTPLFTKEGTDILYLNTYDPDSIPQPMPYELPLSGDLDFLIQHIHMIFGEYGHDFLNYIAYLAQNPGKKIRYMLVLQGGVGTGKGKLMEAITNHVLGYKNCRTIDTNALLSDYNGLLFDAQLIQVEELKVPSRDSHTLMNKIKTIITEPTAVRNEKYMSAEPLPCIASFIALTNHKDCLKNADKRRYHAIISPIQDRKVIESKSGLTTKEYFKRLADIAHPKNPNGGQLRAYFMDYKIPPEFSPDERPEKSDYDKIEKENLDNNDKYSDYIDLIRHVYECDTLPDFIDDKLLDKKSKENNPDTGTPYFSVAEPYSIKQLKKFGKAYGYKIHFRCLYSTKLHEPEAEAHINKIRKSNEIITKNNQTIDK